MNVIRKLLLVQLFVWGTALSITLNYVITEEHLKNHVIGNIASDAGVDLKTGNLRFKILPNDDQALFRIDSVTSRLIISEPFDRDVRCRNEEECVLKLSVAIYRPISEFRMFQVHVVVEDIDDSTPAFPSSSVTLRISESATLGRALRLPVAADSDSPKNSRLSYALITSTSWFRLRSSPDGLDLMLLKSLDRETTREYTLEVECKDGAGNKGHLKVDILVVDVNDNRPRFQRNSYQLFLKENHQVDTNIIRVKASDRDAGEFGEVTYSLATSNDINIKDTFSIDPISGVVRLISSVDYETMKEYRVELVASDGAPEPMTGRVLLTVTVNDTNDNSPLVSVNTMTEEEEGAEGVARVLENSPPGTFLAHVTSRDLDSGVNGATSCHVTDVTSPSSGRFKLLALSADQYKLVTTAVLDREDRYSYRLLLTCTDAGVPNTLTGSARIEVEVTDLNDNSPRFSAGSYLITRREGNPMGTVIGSVRASDPDVGLNALVTYKLRTTSPPQNDVTINSTSGQVRAEIALDYERRSRYDLVVVATDGGGAETRATLSVVVLDVNDNPPVFRQSSLRLSAVENAAPGLVIGYLNSSDLDISSEFRRNRYYVLGERPVVDVEPSSGRVTSRIRYDRETRDVYRFRVEVRDGRNARLKDTGDCVLRVRDVNDNAPVIIAPPHADSVTMISPFHPLGGAVYRVVATDADLVGHVRYAIVPSVAAGFRIDPVTGVITTSRRFEEFRGQGQGESDADFELTVYARDTLGPRDAGTHTVNRRLVVRVNSSVRYRPKVAGSSRGQQLAVVVSVGLISTLVAILLTAAIVVMRRRELRQRKLSTWSLPIRIEKIEKTSSASDNLYDSVSRIQMKTSGNDLKIQRHVIDADLHNYAETTSGSSADSGRGLSETHQDHIGEDKGKPRPSVPCATSRLASSYVDIEPSSVSTFGKICPMSSTSPTYVISPPLHPTGQQQSLHPYRATSPTPPPPPHNTDPLQPYNRNTAPLHAYKKSATDHLATKSIVSPPNLRTHESASVTPTATTAVQGRRSCRRDILV